MSRTRAVAVVVIVVSFVALAAFALFARAYQPARDGVSVPNGLALTPPRQAQAIAASSPAPATVVKGVTQEAPSPSEPSPPPAPPAAAPSDGVQLAACELGLAVPTQRAGLANMVGLVPLFGPFSPEAFAMMPAFEPAFPLLGPMVIAGGEQLNAHEAELEALVSVLRPAQSLGFETISPLYAPHRSQFLAAESQVASSLRPGVEAVASAPGVTCLPAVLALLF